MEDANASDRISRLEARHDLLETYLPALLARFERIEARNEERFDAIDARFERQDARIDSRFEQLRQEQSQIARQTRAQTWALIVAVAAVPVSVIAAATLAILAA